MELPCTSKSCLSQRPPSISFGDGVEGTVEMSPEVSLRLFKEGATFVMLDVPVGTEVGIDMESWNTGERFKGIKMIPPGLHFLYFSAVSKDHQNTAPRTGFFHIFEKKELFATKYDRKMEDISKEPISSEDQSSMKEGLEDMDRFLGAYPYNLWRTWVSLTSRITAETLQRLCPPSGRILSAPELTLDADQTKPSSSNRKMTKLEIAENALPKMTENFDSKIKYTNIPHESFPQGATPQQISKFQLDLSWKLEMVITSTGRPSDYLAELQFSFVTFLVGQHYESFEHWKSMVYLLCHSDDAVVKYPSLYLDFVSDLFFQVREIPEDFFVDIVASNNFLFSCMQRLINNIKEQDKVEAKLKNKVDRFSVFLSSKFSWDFEEEFDEAPTYVDAEDAVISSEREALKNEMETDQNYSYGGEQAEENLELETEAMDIVGDIPIF